MYKVIQILILLLGSQMLKSNIICEGERSFNLPSMPSRLSFTHPPSFFHQYLCPPYQKSLAAIPRYPPVSPSPPLRDVGSLDTTSALSEARLQFQPSLPFSKGCGHKGGERRWRKKQKQGG
jgi:hypothetical protein